MRILTAATLALVVLSAACQPATRELTEEEKATIAESVNAVHDQMIEAAKAVDVDLVLSHWHDSPETTYAMGRTILQGLEDIRAAIAPWYERYGGQQYDIAERQTLVLAPDVVSIVERGSFAWVDKEGNVGDANRYLGTAVYVLRDGSWKISNMQE